MALGIPGRWRTLSLVAMVGVGLGGAGCDGQLMSGELPSEPNSLFGDMAAPGADDAGVASDTFDTGVAEPADAGAGAEVPDATAVKPESCPRVAIQVVGTVLNVRPGPSTSGTPLGALPAGAVVDVLSVAQGEAIDGNSTWYEIRSGTLRGYIFSGFAECTTQQAPVFDGFYLPFACGSKAKVTQGNSGTYSHTGTSAYAFDFSLGIGTMMMAMAPGVVSYVYNKTHAGDPCYSGGGPSCIAKANLVWIKHPDGTQTIYGHLAAVMVKLGQKLTRGQVVGLSGSSGYSTGPHAHVARMKACCQTIPLAFNDVPGKGVPSTGDVVVSGNCP